APRTRWVIPLTLENGEGTQQVLLDDARRRVEAGRCAAPLVADPEGVGYFRVEYDEDLFAALVRRLPMAPAVRLKLLSDSWALAGVGRQPLAGWLAVLDAMRGETQPAVWNEVLTRLAKLDSLAEGEASQAALRQWAIARLHPQLERLGWQARAREPQPVQELRAQLIKDLGRYGDAAVVAGAQRHFARFLRDRRALDGSIADAVIEVAGIHADEATYGQLQRLLKQARDAEEKARYLNALCAVRDEALAGRSLALALDPDLAPALAASVPKRVAGHGGHVRLAWSFAQQHADALMRIAVAFERNRFFGDILTGRVDRHVSDERAGGADEALVEELQAFAGEHLPPEAQAQTQRAVDALRYNARLKQRLLPQLQAVAGVSS
ncbi:MAG TPA: ERAP1-like C-terminal domain-containing protein, partial [Candidatus Binatia bacterium]|nr:ERAP1-like C-terminal domain-containing protein [Candidatus Binatia bacterium]